MKRIILFLLFLPALSVAAGFSLESSDVNPRQPIAEKHVYKGFGCEGQNVSPALAWKNPPKDTKSFALTVFDPDAPTGKGWWHWVVFNLPADATSLAAGAGDVAAGKLPKGAMQSRTDFGKPGWGGPCPPPGDKPHRYVFTLYALKTEKLALDESAPAAMVLSMVNANSLAKASFTAKYGRK